MFGILILFGAVASGLLASRIIEAMRDRFIVEDALVAIPVDAPDNRGKR